MLPGDIPRGSPPLPDVCPAAAMRKIGIELARRVRETLLRLRHPGRRFNCQDQSNRSWELRAEEAVRLFARCSARAHAGTRHLQVGDFACGNERLRPLLERELGPIFDYHGFDLHPQSPSVQRLDLSRDIPARHFDAVFCLGILEYLPDVPAFAARLRSVCQLAVVSYAISDGSEALLTSERRARSWLNHFTQLDVENIFARAGFVKGAFVRTNLGKTGLWVWSTEEKQGSSLV